MPQRLRWVQGCEPQKVVASGLARESAKGGRVSVTRRLIPTRKRVGHLATCMRMRAIDLLPSLAYHLPMRYKIFDVFAKRPFEGNSTGIVYANRPLETDMMQQLANELALRDTIFLLPKSRPELLFSSRTFTPNQELSICGQGLVGAMWLLIDDYAVPSGRHTVETAIGERGALYRAE